AALALPRTRTAWGFLDHKAAWLVLALVVLVFVEVRFFYAYPYLWPQHFLMWAFVLSVLYGLLPGAVLAIWRGYVGDLLSGHKAMVDGACIVGAACAYFLGSLELLPAPSPHPFWRTASYVQSSLRDGEKVWLQPDVHPIGAFDASYYWFSLIDFVPYS